MRFRKHIIYGVILALLLSYYGYFEVIRKERLEEREKAAARVFSLETASVDQIVLQRRGEPEILLFRDPEGVWFIRSPVETQADGMEVEELLGRLNRVSKVRAVSKDEHVDPASFGLAEPELTIRFHHSEGWAGFLIGDKSPVGTEVYAKRQAEPEVFLIASVDRTTLDKSLHALRDKRVFPFQTDEVDHVLVNRSGVHMELVRKETDGWTLKGEEEIRLHDEKVRSLIREFCWARVREFVEEDDRALDRYGLSEPEISVTLGSEESRRVLFLGNHADSPEVYARLGNRPGVVKLSTALLDTLPRSWKELEDRRILGQAEDSMVEVSWKRDSPTYLLRKDAESADWLLRIQNGDTDSGTPVDSRQARNLTRDLSNLEYSRSLPTESDPLNNPQVEFIITLEPEERRLELALAPPPVEKGDEWTAGVVSGGDVQLYAIPPEPVERLLDTLDDLEGEW